MEWIWWNINSTDKTDRESTTWKSEIHRVKSRILECLVSTSFPGFYPGERTWERGWCWITQKSSRYVAIVAKFLDDNKPIKSLKSPFALFQTLPILFSFKFGVVFTYSIKRAREIRKSHVVLVQRRQRNVVVGLVVVQK